MDDDTFTSPTRRRLLFASVASAAAAAGAVVAWQSFHPKPANSEAADRFWQLDFETLDGKRVEAAGLRGKPLLVNFWATWCPPCIEELPLLESFFRANAARGWQVLGLAVDQPSAVQRFLERMPLSFPIALAGPQGTTLSRNLGNQVGGLPYSVVFNAEGKIEHHRIGRVSAEDLRRWTDDAI